VLGRPRYVRHSFLFFFERYCDDDDHPPGTRTWPAAIWQGLMGSDDDDGFCHRGKAHPLTTPLFTLGRRRLTTCQSAQLNFRCWR
jgi:hypothetical protein